MERSLASWSVRIGRGLAAGSLVLGVYVVGVWWAGASDAMTPGSAAMIGLLGAALLLMSRGRAVRLGRGLAVAVVAIGIARGFEHGPMPSLVATLSLAGLGVAIAVLDRAPRLSSGLALLVSLPALIVLFGDLFSYAYFSRGFVFEDGDGLAPDTAAGVLLVATALLAVRPEHGLMATVTSSRLGGKTARWMIAVSLIAVPGTAIGSIYLQEAGLYPAPGAAVIDTVIGVYVALTALIVIGQRLDTADARRAAMTEELRRWKQFFDDAAFGAVFGTGDGKLGAVNRKFAEMHGWTVEELIGRKIDDLYPPEGRVAAGEMLAEIERRGHHRFECDHLRRDGSSFPVVIDATAVHDRHGVLLYRVAYVQDISEERRARAAQARLATIVASAEDAIIAETLDGTVTSWNQGAERTYGWTADEMIGRSIERIVPPGRAGERAALHERFRRDGVVRGFETERVHRDGHLIPIALTWSAIRDEAGAVIAFSTIERDISDERTAAAALARAHAELAAVDRANRAVAEALADTAGAGLEHVLDAIASEARVLTGVPTAIVVRTPDATEDSWAFSGMHRGEAAGLLAGRRPPGLMTVRVLHRGVPIGELFAADPKAEARRVLELLAGHLGSAIEAAIQHEHEAIQAAWLSAVLAQMPEGVVAIDRGGGVVLRNRVAHEFEHEAGQPFRLRDASGRPLEAAEMPTRLALHGTATASTEGSLLRTDGEVVPILYSATPVRADGRIIGGVAVFRDIRELKEIDRMREEWTSLIAHDLRQPVNGMRLATELLLRGKLPENLHGWAERIRADVLRLDTMIADLLDASRLEARRLTLRVAVGALEELIDAALGRVPELREHSEVHIDAAAARVIADPVRVLQVLGNLLGNAVKYGDEGAPVRIAVTCDGEQARISVTNHGPGIPTEEAASLFTRFHRTPSARASAVDGLGLGLYLCKGLVEAHGGRIWCESTPGGTTSFHFTLPLAPQEPARMRSADAITSLSAV